MLTVTTSSAMTKHKERPNTMTNANFMDIMNGMMNAHPELTNAQICTLANLLDPMPEECKEWGDRQILTALGVDPDDTARVPLPAQASKIATLADRWTEVSPPEYIGDGNFGVWCYGPTGAGTYICIDTEGGAHS